MSAKPKGDIIRLTHPSIAIMLAVSPYVKLLPLRPPKRPDLSPAHNGIPNTAPSFV